MKHKWVLIILALFAVPVYPFESTVVPSKSVLVVTEDMRPIKGAMVSQIWKHYSLEGEGNEEDLRTNENGREIFAERRIRASLLSRMLYPIMNILTQGVHASFGISTDIIQGSSVAKHLKESVKLLKWNN